MGAPVCVTSEHPACLHSHGAVRSKVRHCVCVYVCVKAEDGRTAGEESALLHALQCGCKKLGQSLPSR